MLRKLWLFELCIIFINFQSYCFETKKRDSESDKKDLVMIRIETAPSKTDTDEDDQLIFNIGREAFGNHFDKFYVDALKEYVKDRQDTRPHAFERDKENIANHDRSTALGYISHALKNKRKAVNQKLENVKKTARQKNPEPFQ